MFELEKTDEVSKLIAITKSDSGICGPELVRAHIRLGELLAEHMNFDSNDTTVVAIMRGGLFFAQGIYMALGCKFQTYDPKHEAFIKPATKNIILADSVINTGKTIKDIMTFDMWIACCVINAKAVLDFEKYLYTVRVSTNSFVGSDTKKQAETVGPDTTMRLFNLL